MPYGSLEWQKIEIPLGQGGIAEHNDPSQLPPLAFKTLTNVEIDKLGRWRKRYGYTALGTGTITKGARLFTRQNETLLIDGHTLYTYSPTYASTWGTIGTVPEALTSRDTLVRDANVDCWLSDTAYCNGFIAVVYEYESATSAVYATVIEAATGARVVQHQKLSASAANYPHCVAVGTKVVFVWIEGTTIQAVDYDTTTFAFGSRSSIGSDSIHAYGPLDVSPLSSSDFAIAYRNTTPATRVEYIAAGTWTIGSTVTAATNCDGGVTIEAVSGEYTWVATADSTNGVKAYCLNASTLATIAGPITIDASVDVIKVGVGRVDSTHAMFVFTRYTNATGQANFCNRRMDNAGLLSASTSTTYWTDFVSKPWTYDSTTYVVGSFRGQYAGAPLTSLNSTYFVLRLTSDGKRANPVATMAPRVADSPYSLAATYTAGGSPVCYASSGGSGKYYFARQVAADFYFDSKLAQNIRLGVDLFTIDLGSAARWLPCNYDQTTYLAGGLPSYYDGMAVPEIGFCWFPENISATDSASAGSMNAAEVYNYIVTYEYTDSQGIRHRSAPSASVQHTVGAGKTAIDLTVYPLNLGGRESSTNPTNVEIVVYRTENGGTVYYRVTVGTTTVKNTPDSGTAITYTDTSGSTDNSTHEQLYTGSGELENVIPPCLSHICQHKGRLFGVGEDGFTIWYTKPIVSGEAPGFNEALQIEVRTGEKVTALASLDDKLIIWTKNRTFAVYGDGPSATGAGSPFSDPQQISGDVGCDNPRSVCVYADGVMFHSSRGLYIMTRGLELVQQQDIEDTLASYPYIQSAVVLHARQQIRVEATTTEPVPGTGPSNGRCLCFDFQHKRPGSLGTWTVQLVYVGDGNGSTSIAVSGAAGLEPGEYGRVQANGTVQVENSSTYLDGSDFVSAAIETGRIGLDGLLGYQRVASATLYADMGTRAGLSVAFALDGGAYSTATTWTDTEISLLATGSVTVAVANRRCNQLSVFINDTAPASAGNYGTGEGFIFRGLALKVGVMGGPRRHAATARK